MSQYIKTFAVKDSGALTYLGEESFAIKDDDGQKLPFWHPTNASMGDKFFEAEVFFAVNEPHPALDAGK